MSGRHDPNLPVMARPKWGEPGSKVKRKTTSRVFSAGKYRPVIVTVYPDGVIGLRLHKHKREEYLTADSMYRAAVVARVSAERAAKRKARKGGA
jgi:hypothetical protein